MLYNKGGIIALVYSVLSVHDMLYPVLKINIL